MTPHAELIGKLEKATGSDRMIDAAITGALGIECTDDVFLLRGNWPPAYTASIDAALTLVPEGWRAGFEDAGRSDHFDVVDAWCWPFESDFDPDWMNGHEGYRSSPDGFRAAHKSRAIALCIASLKARASLHNGMDTGTETEGGDAHE